MWFEALRHAAGRAGSAACSFLLFALVARYCAPGDAKAVFFFAFALGFLISGVRTFGSIAAVLEGRARRGAKLARVIAVTGQLARVQVVVAGLAALLFRTHPISPAVVAAACAVVPLAGFDTDLLRASLHRRSTFSVLFAFGGVLAVSWFVASPQKTVDVACVALLLQWAPVIACNLYAYARLFRRRTRRTAMTVGAPAAGLVGAAGLAAFDGLVLNLPFLVADRIDAAAGLDLSVGTRTFVSSLALAPLLVHWSNAGRLSALARRLSIDESRLFLGAVAGSALAGSAVLALVYSAVSGRPVTPVQYGCCALLVAAYAIFASRVRYRRPAADDRALPAIAAVLLAYACAYLALTRFRPDLALGFAALEAIALAGAGEVLRFTSSAAAAREGVA